MSTQSKKQIQIDRASKRMLTYISIGSFLLVFTLLSSKSLISQMNYQNKIIDKKNQAYKQIEQNNTNNDKLIAAYKAFNGTDYNLIGGPTSGSGPNSGNNSKIILDALPSEYDYPALASSLNYLLSNKGVTIGGFSGSAQVSATPSVGGITIIPVSFSFSGPVDKVIGVLDTFQKSIRPFNFATVSISGDSKNLSVSVSAETYFSSPVKFNITKQAVK